MFFFFICKFSTIYNFCLLLSYLLYIQQFIISEDACWNKRNGNFKSFFSFQECVCISLRLSPQFAFCFFLSLDGQNTKVSTYPCLHYLLEKKMLPIAWGRLEISRWSSHSGTIFEAYLVNSLRFYEDLKFLTFTPHVRLIFVEKGNLNFVD